MYVIGYRWTNPIDFGECRINKFFTGKKKNFYTLRPMESNFLKCPSIQTVHSMELKFGMRISGHCRTKLIAFDECRVCSIFYMSTKKILIHYGPWNQILKIVLVSK